MSRRHSGEPNSIREVYQPGEQPSEIREKVPVPLKAQIFMTRHRDHGNELSSSLDVHSRSLGLCFFVKLSHSLPGVQLSFQ
jgi:hypothetical protein